MLVINKKEAIALFSFVITIPLCIILIVGYVINNTTDKIADSMIDQYCIDKSNIGATEFYIEDVGDYRFVISTADMDNSKSVELFIFKADENENFWTYYGGVPGGSESSFNIYSTELELSHNTKDKFNIIYSDNINGIAKIVLYSADNVENTVIYEVEPDEPFIIIDNFSPPKGTSYDLYDLNGNEITY